MPTEYSQSIIHVKSQSSLTAYSYGSNFHFMKFGDRLRLARERAHLTQEELAVKAQVKQGTISKIERGDTESSTFTVQLAVACGVRPEWLAMESGDMIDSSDKPYPATSDPIIESVVAMMKPMDEYQKRIVFDTSSSVAKQTTTSNDKGTTKNNGTQ